MAEMSIENALSIVIEIAEGALELVYEMGQVDATNPNAQVDIKKGRLAISKVKSWLISPKP